MSTVHDPGGMGFRIEKLYVGLAEHGLNDEGVMAVYINGSWFPAVATKVETVRNLLAMASPEQRIKPVRIVCFETRTEVERAW